MSELKKQNRQSVWTPEERKELDRLADRIQAERPTIADLVASGNYDGPLPLGVYQDYVFAMLELKRAREEQGLSLADVAERSGIDKASISKLESGQTNPTFQTIARYAYSIGMRIKIVSEDLATLDEAPALSRSEPVNTSMPAMA
jgi:DNA-binding XRE family transcriptional regulator